MSFDLSFEGLLIAFALLAAAAIALMAIAIAFQRGVNNMPLVARYDGLAERIDERRQSLADIEQQISDRQITLTERDLAKAEIEAQQQVLARIRDEIAGLDAGRADVEKLNAEINEAVIQHAEATQALEAKQAELREAADRAEAAERRAIRREGEIDALEAREKALREAVEKAQVDAEQAQAIRAEADALARRRDDLKAEAATLDATIAARKAALAQVEDDLARTVETAVERTALIEEVAALKRQRDAAREGLDDLGAQRQRAEAGLAQAEAARAAAVKRDEDEEAGADGRDVLVELRKPPACLRPTAETGFSSLADENQALEQVQDRLRALGLTFEDRVVKAFHTSLKISDASPLAVLAGISGTGKSQLPRRYAEAMGINFLQVAVQPRWDSPQDLLGFYNYIEGGYRPTELSQAMLHLDMFNAPEQAAPYDGQMLLVLLDEMNLARVEYYFSEFLSRLEARPADGAGHDSDQRRAAEIVIDAPMKDLPPQRIYPGHNILFVGTMNEDESTQALSEKVLDRANVLHFSRPRSFASVDGETTAASPVTLLRHDAWRGWIRGADALSSGHAARTRETIGSLADIMAGCGKPFGHRLNRAMTLYVANHPDTVPGGPDAALVDQIETRILPRLRGADLDASREPLSRLEALTEALGDAQLARAIKAANDRGASLFAFRGREEF